jgi:hypothetical protein
VVHEDAKTVGVGVEALVVPPPMHVAASTAVLCCPPPPPLPLLSPPAHRRHHHCRHNHDLMAIPVNLRMLPRMQRQPIIIIINKCAPRCDRRWAALPCSSSNNNKQG